MDGLGLSWQPAGPWALTLPITAPSSVAPGLDPCAAAPMPQVVGLISGLGLSWQASFGLILTLYFYRWAAWWAHDSRFEWRREAWGEG